MENEIQIKSKIKNEKTRLLERDLVEDHHGSYNAIKLSVQSPESLLDDANHHFYQKFIWFISRARFYRILKRLNLPKNHESLSLSEAPHTTIENHTYSLSQEEQSLENVSGEQYRSNERIDFGFFPHIDAFLNGFYLVTNKLWPPALFGLLIHDFIIYVRNSSIRTNDPIWEILIGIAENDSILSNSLGSNIKSAYFKYWFGAGIVMAAPLIAGLANITKHYYLNKKYELDNYRNLKNMLINSKDLSFITPVNHLWHALHRAKYAILCDHQLRQSEKDELYQLISNVARNNPRIKPFIFEILADIADYPKLTSTDQTDNEILLADAQSNNSSTEKFNSFYANYKLWSLGETVSTQYNILFSMLFPLFTFTLYAKSFFTWILIKKYFWQNPTSNHPNNTTCVNDAEIVQFLPEISETVCSMCGNWPFVYINNINNMQGCVSDLLAVPRSPDVISSSLQQLTRFSNNTKIEKFDLSKQNWTSWTRSAWQNILNILPKLTTTLKIFNASLPQFNTTYIDDGKLNDLAGLTHQITIEQFDFKNLGANSSLISSFFNNAYLAFTTYFDLSANNLNNDTFVQVCQFLPRSTTTFIVANNNINDTGFISATPYLVNSSIQYLDISNTSISTQITQGIATLIKNGILKMLKFAGNNLTGINLTTFWQATTQNSSLKEIDLSNTTLSDQQIASAGPYLSNSSITDFNLSNNSFGDIGAGLFISGAKNSSINKIDFSFTLITDVSINKIAQNLRFIPITELILNGVRMTLDGLQQLLNGTINSILKKLSLKSTDSDDISAEMIAKQLQHPNNTLRAIDLSSNNDITDVGGQALGNATGNSSLEEIKLDNNKQITSKTAVVFANNFNKGHLKIFSANGCNIDADGSTAIAENLDGSSLEELYLDENPLLDNGTLLLALKLITPTSNPSDLSNPTLTAEEANSLNNTKPASNLKVLSLNNVGLGVGTARIICRTVLKSNIEENDLDIDNNPVDPEEVDLQNCRFDNNLNGSDTIQDFKMQNSNSSLYLSRSVNANSYTVGQNEITGLNTIFIMIPLALLIVLAIYLIYKAVTPSANQLAAKSLGIFSKNDKSQRNNTMIAQDKIDQDKEVNNPEENIKNQLTT